MIFTIYDIKNVIISHKSKAGARKYGFIQSVVIYNET
jgi:hypothetical protein